MTDQFSIRVTTSNIQNFPNMTDAQVREDVATVKKHTGLALFQEIAEKRDVLAVEEILGSGFSVVGTRRECPIAFRNSRFKQLDPVKVTKISDSLGRGSHSPARFVTHLVLAAKGKGSRGLPPIEVFNAHYVQGAFSRVPKPMTPQRRKNWALAWEKEQALVLAAYERGHVVIFGGDWNRPAHGIQPFHPNQRWVVGGKGGIDHIGLLLPKGVRVKVTHPINIDLNSDHNLKGATLVFTATATTAK